MTDDHRGMEGFTHRIRHLIRTAIPVAILAGALAVAGCGGGGDKNNSAKPPAPVKQSSSNGNGVVTAVGTQGLVGGAGRASATTQDFRDKPHKIPRNANRKPKNGNGVAGGENCTDTGITPSDSNMDTVNAAVFCLLNGERVAAGLPALTQNSQLAQAAKGMCGRMVSERFFAHETPDGKTVVDRIEPTGYIPNSGDWVVGENLGWGSGALSTPQAIVNGWMNSAGHRANILAPDYKDIGLAACMGSPSTTTNGGTVYVNNFGAKSGADVNAKLPPEGSAATSDSSSAGADLSNVAGTKATSKSKAKKKAKRKKKARKSSKKR